MRKLLFGLLLTFIGGLPLVGQHPINPIIDLVKQGELNTAQRLLNENLELEAGDQDSRLLLGMLLAMTGHHEEAVGTWEGGLCHSPTDFALLLHIGEVRIQQSAMLGQGQITSMLPAAAEGGTQTQKRALLELAKQAYEQAQQLYPYQSEPTSQLATVNELLDDYGKALDLWERLVYTYPSDENFLVSLGQCALYLGQEEKAKEVLTKALALNPHHAPAYAKLATYWQAKGDTIAAQTARQQHEFYTWLPRFATFEYNDHHYQTYQLLKNPLLANQSARSARLADLINDKSEIASRWLAALCWHHGEDESTEDLLVDELGSRGMEAAPLLVEMIKHSQHDALIGKVTIKLTALRIPGIFDLLVGLLPRDRQSYFSMNIAYQLAVLGNDLAIPYLLRELHPSHAQEVLADHEFDLSGGALQDSRNRAALALAFFDVPMVVQELEAGLSDPIIQQSCAAALYRITMDERYLAQVKRSKNRPEDRNVDLAAFLRIIGTKQALATANKLE